MLDDIQSIVELCQNDSLLLGIQLMFSFMLADDENPLRICRNCAKVYVAKRKNQDFCGTECRKLYDARKKDDTH